ncbi:hypothetical protein KIN20_023945 [Parelaphostrongylus tenuis]|uniref:SCP domain-containing protein n=1 Tax=Parelaphostrongylus tenuis TaxID=148309 RepID=A0AAD5QXI2_PARTN|nr:hypothetical protein KIN20_023945 [Parelaphostrongylus tenuis]
MRSKVALGQFRAQNILSSASNMDKMAWNCELEKLAEEVVAKCRKNLPPIGRKYGRNYLLFGPSSTVYQRQFPLQSAMKQWSAISNLAWPASNIFNGNLALRPFANIIRAKTVSVGCSADKCRGRSAVACVFSSPNVRRRSKVYISGTPCQDDHQSLVTRGLARNAEHAGENAPPSSRMDLMEYDCHAEQVAHNHILSCNGQPAPPTSRPGYSENVHVLSTTATDVLGAIQNAIGMFTNELGGNGIPSNMLFTSSCCSAYAENGDKSQQGSLGYQQICGLCNSSL